MKLIYKIRTSLVYSNMKTFKIDTGFFNHPESDARCNVMWIHFCQKAYHHTLSCGRFHGGILTKTGIDSFTGMPGKIIVSPMLAL